MSAFETIRLTDAALEIAPDDSRVRMLARHADGSMAQFELAPGQISRPVAHRKVEEIWFVLSGHGKIWRRQGTREEIVALEPSVSLTIPLGTHFQFRANPDGPLSILCVTTPPWPGNHEAFGVEGPWAPTQT